MLPFSRFGAAKPCLGQPWRPPPVRCTRGDVGRRSTGDIIRHGPEAIKRHILFFAGGYYWEFRRAAKKSAQ